MRLEAARARARAANEAALEAEKLKDAAEEEVEALRDALDPKRQRTAAASSADDDGPAQATDDWDLADHRREMTRTLNRRAVELGSAEHTPQPRTGQQGYLQHPRHGLVGAVRYWARGVMALAALMIAALICKLGIEDEVRAKLPDKRLRLPVRLRTVDFSAEKCGKFALYHVDMYVM